MPRAICDYKEDRKFDLASSEGGTGAAQGPQAVERPVRLRAGFGAGGVQ